MFKEIRNKITFFNMITLVAFLIIFILLIIVFIKWTLVNSGKAYLKEAAQTIISNTERSDNSKLFNTTIHSELGFEYIIWNYDIGIVEQNVNNRDLIEESHNLLYSSQTNNPFTTINTNNGTFRIYETTFSKNNTDYILYIFQNITLENEIVSYLITYLLVLGLIGIICLIPIAFILAGRSLIPIKQSYEEQKKFIADASHELRSPLNVIQTSVDVLSFKGNETIKSNKKWINNIAAECQNMTTLINDLTEIARADNNQFEYTDREINLSQLVEEVIFLLKSTAHEKNLEIKEFIEPNILIFADSDKIRQLIRIFLDNAVKYSKEFSEISVSLMKKNNNIILSFNDQGIGISSEDISKIFDRFYRCDNARSRQVSGTGLGLNIAQNIVNYYNGKIDVYSELGKGSNFIVTLPKTKLGS